MKNLLYDGAEFIIVQDGNDIVSITKKEDIEYSRLDVKEGKAKHWYARQIMDFLYEKYGKQKPISVLFLGVALGAMPYELLRQNGVATAVCVDIDPESVFLVQKSILKQFGERALVVQEDAKTFVSRIPAKSFDAVVVDIFSQDRTPAFLQEKSFLQNCFRLLKPNGAYVANIIAQSSDMSYGIVLRSFANQVHRVARDPQGKTNIVYMAY
jgi:spermidine synthase